MNKINESSNNILYKGQEESHIAMNNSMNQEMIADKAHEEKECILIIEDEPVQRKKLQTYLENEGYKVISTDKGTDALNTIEKNNVCLVLLDINLPGQQNGITITKSIRTQSDVGIILVTSKTEKIDTIVGLECGADDYVTKPFNERELLGRARNLIKRVLKEQNQKKNGHIRYIEGWKFNLRTRELISKEGKVEVLATGEYNLLMTFIDSPGKLFSRDELMINVRNREWLPNDRYIDVLIGQLRKKFCEKASTATIIITIHGSGYLFTEKVSITCDNNAQN